MRCGLASAAVPCARTAGPDSTAGADTIAVALSAENDRRKDRRVPQPHRLAQACGVATASALTGSHLIVVSPLQSFCRGTASQQSWLRSRRGLPQPFRDARGEITEHAAGAGALEGDQALHHRAL